MRRAVVIGGGVTGLVSAYELAKSGTETVLVEPKRLGGVIRTAHRSGFTLEEGPNVFIGKPEFLELLDELGLAPEIVRPAVEPYDRHVFHEGKPLPVPAGPLALVGTPLLPVRARLAIVRKILFGGALAADGDDVSVYDFFAPFCGVEAVERIVDPALRGIFGGDIRRLSARSLFPELWEAARAARPVRELLSRGRGKPRSRVLVLRGGNEMLVRRLSERFAEHGGRVITSAARTLTREDGVFQVRTVSGEVLAAERVVAATSGAATAGYLKSLEPELAESLRRVTYAPLVVVHCGIPAGAGYPRGSFGALNPSSSDTPILGFLFSSELFPHVAPEGRALVTACLGGVDHEAVTALSEGAAVSLVAEALRHHFGVDDMEPLGVTVWERAIPQFEVGHHRLVEAMRRTEERHAGLALVGVDTGFVGVPDRAARARARFAR